MLSHVLPYMCDETVTMMYGSVEQFNGGVRVVREHIGFCLLVPIQTSAGTLVPQVRGAWEHEFEDDGTTILGFPLGERDEDTAVFGAGIGYYFNSGWNTVLDYEGRLGSNIEGHYVSLKVGKEF